MNKDEIKNGMMFEKPIIQILQDNRTHMKIIGECDLFNNHIEYQIVDNNEEIIYNSSYNIGEIIDIYYDLIEDKKKRVLNAVINLRERGYI